MALRKERLPVPLVQHLHQLLGGDARLEKMVLDYIAFRWQAKNLFYVPPKAAGEIIRRPADFLRAAKDHCEPELSFPMGTFGKAEIEKAEIGKAGSVERGAWSVERGANWKAEI